MLFVVPGIIAYYRYSFALYNLYDNPGLNIMEALEMSKQQTRGWKLELLKLMNVEILDCGFAESCDNPCDYQAFYNAAIQDIQERIAKD